MSSTTVTNCSIDLLLKVNLLPSHWPLLRQSHKLFISVILSVSIFPSASTDLSLFLQVVFSLSLSLSLFRSLCFSRSVSRSVSVSVVAQWGEWPAGSAPGEEQWDVYSGGPAAAPREGGAGGRQPGHHAPRRPHRRQATEVRGRCEWTSYST